MQRLENICSRRVGPPAVNIGPRFPLVIAVTASIPARLWTVLSASKPTAAGPPLRRERCGCETGRCAGPCSRQRSSPTLSGARATRRTTARLMHSSGSRQPKARRSSSHSAGAGCTLNPGSRPPFAPAGGRCSCDCCCRYCSTVQKGAYSCSGDRIFRGKVEKERSVSGTPNITDRARRRATGSGSGAGARCPGHSHSAWSRNTGSRGWRTAIRDVIMGKLRSLLDGAKGSGGKVLRIG